MAIVNLIPSQGRLQVKTDVSAIINGNFNVITYDTGYNGLASVSINPIMVSNNRDKPNDISSSGTISRGKYLQISNGHISDDRYYLAQPNAGTAYVTQSGISSVDGFANVDIPAGTITNNTSGGTSSGTISFGKQIKIGAGYYNSDIYYKAQDTAGTITNNTSGGTSSGTINFGKQIKIGAGYYSKDYYYTAQAPSGTYTVTSSGTKNVTDKAYVDIPACGAATTSISINSAGKISASTAIASAGWVTATSFSNTYQMTTQGPTTWNTVKDNNVKILNSGTYLTGNQLMRYVRHANITAGNIKKGVRVIVGDGANTTRIVDVTGTY